MKLAITVALVACSLFIPITTVSYGSEFDKSRVIVGQFVYKPYYTEAGHGVAIDLLIAAFLAVDIKTEIKILPLHRAKQRLMDNTIDLYGGGGVRNFTEEEKAAYGIEMFPYFSYTLSLAYYRPNLSLNDVKRLDAYQDDLRTLQGLTFGSTAVYPGESELLAAGLKMVEYGLNEGDISYQQLRMLESGRFDTTQLTMLSAIALIDESFSGNWYQFGLTAPFMIEPGMQFYVTGNPRSAYFHAQFRKGLDLIMEGGKESQYFNILESYWGENNVPYFVLPAKLQVFGVARPLLEKALSYQRDDNWRIIAN